MAAARWFHRAREDQSPSFEALGWVRAAEDASPSVGPLVLLEWRGAGSPLVPGEPMTNLPTFGDRVRVWPASGARVQDGASGFGRFLAPEGREVVWDEYWHRRLLEGGVHLHDPTPAKAAAKKE